MESIRFRQSFTVRYLETDMFQELEPTALLAILEETAASHCNRIGFSMPLLDSGNIGWVLLTGFMQMNRYPVYGEKITVETWISGYSGTRAYRENLIYDGDGTVIGLARSRWVFYDTKAERPIKIYTEIIQRWKQDPSRCTEENIDAPIGALEKGRWQSECVASHFDIDTNGHVNNIRYLQWLLESTPQEVKNNGFLHSVNGRFLNESYLGDLVASITSPDESGDSYRHTIRKTKNNLPLAAAKTVWKPRI